MERDLPNESSTDDSSHEEIHSDDGYDGYNGEDDDLRRCTQNLGITKEYVPRWTSQDAFRELYQNWKDEIIISFGLSQRSFKTRMKELRRPKEIHILAYQTVDGKNEEKLLGYIRFKEKKGSLELTNFKARITRSNLSLGNTTKRHRTDVAGTHGEGLKIAALVLRRKEYRVRLTSRSYNWTFGFRGPSKSTLFCKLSPISATQERQAQRISGKLKANPETDVCVLVDGSRGGKKVSQEDFRKWIKVTLDIDRPKDTADIIETPQGDLILDNKFAGRMYLKGLWLPSGYARKVHAGYNLLKGTTSRDRSRLRNEEEEAKMLMHIWEHAIESCGDNVLQRYIDLLKDQTCVDVTNAERLITRKTAVAIWERLKSQGTDKFYYFQKEEDPGISLIEKNLKLKPVLLPEKLWQILERFHLVRTPRGQCIHLFGNSPPTQEPVTVFYTNIQRGLKASLDLHERTQQVNVEYVRGGETGINMLFDKDQKLLKVHDKWLNFTKIHEKADCRISVMHNTQVIESNFFCDHIIEELYDLAVHEIIGSSNPGDTLEFARSMRVKIREELQQIPRVIKIMSSDEPRKLVVTWTIGESELVWNLLGNDISSTYCVTLHRDRTCSHRKSEYLYRPVAPDDGSIPNDGIDRACACPRMEVPNTCRQAEFPGLEPQEQYFPMIARAQNDSFYGIPPPACRPSPRTSRRASRRGDVKDILFGASPDNIACSVDDNEDETIREAHANISPSPANTNPRTQLTDRTRESQQDPQWEQEQEKKLSCWEKENLQSSFDPFFSSRKQPSPDVDLSPIRGPASRHPSGYRFTTRKHAQIRLRPEIETAEPETCVIYVHGILQATNEKGEIHQRFLLVSRYSFLESFHPFSSTQKLLGPISKKELLLHFTNFNTMGEREDAETIPFSEIMDARDLEPNEVKLVTDAPTDPSAFYYRFAIRGKVGDESACLTPIGSNLPIPEYSALSEPILVDFSPSVLGLADGFFQENFKIAAGVGFDPVNDMTWKARYPSTEVYDDDWTNSVLPQIINGQLPRPEWLVEPGTAKVAVIGSTCHHLGLCNRIQKVEQSDHSEALRIVQAIMKSPSQVRSFDFLVCTMPAAAVHPELLPIFIQTIWTLLEKQYSVHIKKLQLPDYDTLVDKAFIVILASPICTEPRWNWSQPQNQKTLEDVIGDLPIQQPANLSLKCKRPSTKNETVLNHDTGCPSTGARPLAMNAEAVKFPLFGPPLFRHPTRKDLLTTRELARIYGFPDDFVFYDGSFGSYNYFAHAIPPVIARIVAKGIREMIDECRVLELGDASAMEGVEMDARGIKRQRSSEI